MMTPYTLQYGIMQALNVIASNISSDIPVYIRLKPDVINLKSNLLSLKVWTTILLPSKLICSRVSANYPDTRVEACCPPRR